MKNQHQKTLLALVVLTTMLLTIAPAIHADASLSITTSAATVAVGKTLTISVKVSGVPDLSSVGFDLKFDPAAFTFASGSINGTAESGAITDIGSISSNTVRVSASSYKISSSSNPLIATLKFTAKAINSGASFSVSEISLGDYASVASVPATFAGAKSVSVFQPSVNADLSKLAIAPGTLSPAFTSTNITYTVQVAEGVNALSVDAAPADTNAKISVSGHTALKSGENTVKVTVTAESGAVKTYTIRVYKAVPTPTPSISPTPAATLQINGGSYSITELVAGQNLPTNFEAALVSLQGKMVPGFVSVKFGLTILYLKDDTGKNDFYIFDPIGGSFTRFQTVIVPARNYIILKMDASIPTPAGFSSATLTIDNSPVSGFQEIVPAKDGTKQTLIYMMDSTGAKNLYVYNASTGDLQLFTAKTVIPTATVSLAPTATISATPTPIPKSANKNELSNYLLIILGLAILVIVLLGILTYLLVARKSGIQPKNKQLPNIRRVD
jgi:hypothetical protein